MQLWLEFKSNEDAFSDNQSPGLGFIQNIQKAEEVLGQLIAYAVAHLSCQFCTHSFSVLVTGNFARLIRWDRARAIVTESFSYVSKSTLLSDFFYRFDDLTPEQQGCDTTVRSPSSEDLQSAADMLRPIPEAGETNKQYNNRLKDFSPKTFVEYLVHGSTVDSEPLRFIGPRPKCFPMSLQGRASRGCPVYDVKNKPVCYLKDTWRVDFPLLEQEGRT